MSPGLLSLLLTIVHVIFDLLFLNPERFKTVENGRSRNLCIENANTNQTFHVTLVIDDSTRFSAHKGSNHKRYNVEKGLRILAKPNM
jgi:hypothetical protein